MKIGVILGSIREGRFGQGVAEWAMEQIASYDAPDAEFELIDLKAFNVPLLESVTVPGAANKQYDDPNVTAWSKAIDACDAFIFITPEYNHGVPGAFKNAYDVLGNEWLDKPVAFVSYGSVEGIRVVEQWRQIIATFNMYDIRSQLTFSTFTENKDGVFSPNDRRAGELVRLLDGLLSVLRA
ncbi:NADPH-dependent FMN reductase [Corynebacterium crudilactis]|uniref:NADPH-dependent FMN reductase n=1 Tax=Corynebacterium crudilactis TaxID=1652495 RepID=A0A172QWI6_9CORY|nr:NADPH-dependent FMN reductase [Corynebacterium crudilactis]ANE05075.1 NADPH-dependent FMN reductase [Corynebacterium crudilactis]